MVAPPITVRNAGILWGAILVIVGALELNAIKGKLGPMTTVKGVVHMSFALTLVLYAVVEALT